MYDGINLSPYEVMFVKIKDYLLQANWTTATQVKKYTDWARDHVRRIRVCVCVWQRGSVEMGALPRTRLLALAGAAVLPFVGPPVDSTCRHKHTSTPLSQPNMILHHPTPSQGQHVASNEYSAKREHLRRIKIISMRERGPRCFDFDYYHKRNPDLPVPPWTAANLWEHFVKDGQHEGRVFRFRCPEPGEAVALALPSPPAALANAAPATPGGDAAQGGAAAAADGAH